MNLFIYKTEMFEDDYNFFLKDENLNTDSDSISFFKDNASTYMGVKTIQEGTVADTNKNQPNKKNSPKKNKYNKKGKKKKKSSSSSNSSFSSSSSESSESYIDLNEKILIDQNNEEKINTENLKEIDIIQKNNNENENNDNISNEIRTEFYWDEGGNTIYITGSFCNWEKFLIMEKNEKGIYTKTLMLPPGFYQYKFKVDDNWAYSKKQPKFEDNNGNVNNFIDTTNYENSNQNKNEEKKVKSNKDNKDLKKIKEEKQKKVKRNSSNNSIGNINNSNYSTYIPLKGELSIKPLSLPGLYKTHYILNEKKNKIIKERKFSQIEYVDHTNNSIRNSTQNLSSSNYFVNNDPYVGFQNLYHIHSNHLHSKEIVDPKNAVTSIITRYRAKFSTFIYYKGKKLRERSDKRHSKSVKLNDDLDEKISKIVKGQKDIIYK